MVDKFFDALNVHNYTHGVHSRKRFQMPYTSGEDMRLKVYIPRSAHIGMNSWIYLILCYQWLERDFLGYLAEWEESVRKRPGYIKTEQNRMLLSAETWLGLQTTCKIPVLV